MNIIGIIQYTSSVVWSLPPFRQNKGNFFYYFLFVAISDPMVLLLRGFRLVPSNVYFVLTVFGSLVSIISIDKRIRWSLVLTILAATLALALSLRNWDIAYIILTLLVLILFYSIRYITIFAEKMRYISFFHFLFLLYNTSLLIKLVNAMLDPRRGAIFFYFTTVFDILLGMLFCIFREESKRFAIRLREPASENSPLQDEFISRKNEKVK